MLDIDKRYSDLPWLGPARSRLAQQLNTDRLPHALLIHGLAGVGRRELALWLVEQVLGARPATLSGGESGAARQQADLLLLQPPDGKFVIPVDSVRLSLTPFLGLTSHGSGRRVALIFPAEALARSAANALLKTLEEPPPGCLIILLAERPGQVPPTVLSRCQQLHIPPPSRPVAVNWLAEQCPGKDFSALLSLCGNAPLAALALEASGAASFANELMAGLQRLENRQVDPLSVAGAAAKQPELALDLLEWRLCERIRAGLQAGSGATADWFRKLDQIRELRRVINGGIKPELSLAGLLLDW